MVLSLASSGWFDAFEVLVEKCESLIAGELMIAREDIQLVIVGDAGGGVYFLHLLGATE